jgi:hypothetical protein
VLRFDPTGRIAWMHNVPAQSVAIGGGHVVSAGCTEMTVYDDASGLSLWQTPVGGCTMTPVVLVDDGGSVYRLEYEADGFHAFRYDADGNAVWTVPVPAGSNYTDSKLLGPSGGLLFAVAASNLVALRVVDGSVAWSAPASDLALLAGSPAEPIAADLGMLTRFSADSGTPRWSVPIANIYALAAAGDALIAGVPTHAVARVDLASGALGWTTTLPLQDALGNDLHNVAIGGFVGDTFAVVEKPDTTAAAPPVIQRIALADGALAGTTPVPNVAQGPYAVSIADGGDRIVGVQRAWTTSQLELRVRRIARATGAIDWSIDDPIEIDLASFYEVPTNGSSDLSVSADGIAVATSLSIPHASLSIGVGAARVAYYERVNGARRWQAMLGTIDQGETYGTPPLPDPRGDLFVGVGSWAYCPAAEGDSCEQQEVYKLSRNDGHVIWHRAITSPSYGSIPYPPTLTLVGNDAVQAGPFEDGVSSDTLRAIDGSNGTERWASQIFGYRRINAVYAAGSDVLAIADGDGWAKLDGATGATLWTGPSFPPSGCTFLCNPANVSAVLADGDVVAAGDADYRAVVTRLATDGSGDYESWVLDPDSRVRSQIVNVAEDAEGGIWLGILRGFVRGTGGVSVLARFDPATGTLTRQQVLRNRQGDPLEPMTLADWIGAPGQERLVLESYTIESPAPTASGNVMLDTTIAMHGDLAASLDVDPPLAHAGDTVAFHARMTYAGDSALAGAHLNVYIPWGSGARNLACSATSGTCAVESMGDSIRATADLQPGDAVDLTGEAQVLAMERYTESSSVTAVAYGPLALDEPDTRNNLAQRTVSHGIFTDGFDGP